MTTPQPTQRDFELRFVHDGVEHTITFMFDLSLYSHRVILSFLAEKQFYEPGSTQVLLQVLKPGDTFIDIGAHIGYYTLLASRLVGPTGHVHAFEPEISNYQRLLRHLRRNGITNVRPFNWALSNTIGIADLRICVGEDGGNDGGHGIWDMERRNGPDAAPLPLQPTFSLPLDTLFSGAQPGSVKAIKLDTEGFELQVLHGMRNLLAGAKVPVVICEINHALLPHLGVTEQQIRDFMLDLGYRIFLDHPETGRLIQLEATQKAETAFVYNLVFVRPEAIAQTPAPLE